MEIDGRTPLTNIKMTFKSKVPAQTPIKMTLALDNSGILHIMAEELLNHSSLDTTFQLSNQMSDDELKAASYRLASSNVE